VTHTRQMDTIFKLTEQAYKYTQDITRKSCLIVDTKTCTRTVSLTDKTIECTNHSQPWKKTTDLNMNSFNTIGICKLCLVEIQTLINRHYN